MNGKSRSPSRPPCQFTVFSRYLKLNWYIDQLKEVADIDVVKIG